MEATAVAALHAAVEVELIEGSSHLDHAALRTAVEFLARRLAEPLGCLSAEVVDPGDPVLGWDEVNADIC